MSLSLNSSFLCRGLKVLLKYRFFIGTLVLVVVCSLTYAKYANSLPLGVHNWAQSDRYSVAVRYLDNTNFLKAQTHNASTIDERCGVEFPFIQYTSARISSIFSPKALPIIYRSLNLFLLILGFWFFMRQWKISKNLQYIVGVSLFFSPLLFFYAFNFLPDTTGLAFLLIGLGHFIRFNNAPSIKSGVYAIIFAGIATLIKTTCGIYLIAMAGTIGLFYLKPFKLQNVLKIFVCTVLVGSVIWFYDYYFFHKINEDFYSRIFMSKQQPIVNLQDFRGFRKGVIYWHGQFLTWPQTLLGVGLIILAFKQRKSEIKNKPGKRFFFTSLFGLLLFFKLMGIQFINHDYYFIAAVLPLFFILIWLLITHFRESSILQNKWLIGSFFGIMVWTMFLSIRDYDKRMSSHFIWKHRDIITDIEWMQNGDQIITDIGIPSSAKVFIGYDAAPNTALVYFNRIGKAFNHEEMTRDSSNMKYWSERIQPDYYIFPNAWVTKLPTDQPWLFQRLVLFAKRPNFVIYKPITINN